MHTHLDFIFLDILKAYASSWVRKSRVFSGLFPLHGDTLFDTLNIVVGERWYLRSVDARNFIIVKVESELENWDDNLLLLAFRDGMSEWIFADLDFGLGLAFLGQNTLSLTPLTSACKDEARQYVEKFLKIDLYRNNSAFKTWNDIFRSL